ncbi:MAG: hypothetical protein WCI30_04795 [Clostridia bacterium]
MIKIKKSLVLLLLICFSITFCVQGAEVYTLSTAKTMLLQNNEDIILENLSVNAAYANYAQALADKYTGNTTLAYQLNTEIVPAQTLIALEQATKQLESLKKEKLRELEKNFYQTSFLTQELSILQAKLSIAEKNNKANTLRYQRGIISKYTLNQAGNEVLQLKATLLSKQAEQRKVDQNFALLLQLDPAVTYNKETLIIPLSSHYSLSDLESYISNQLSINKEYSWLQQEAALASKEYELTVLYSAGSDTSKEIARLQAAKKKQLAQNSYTDFPTTFAQSIRTSYYLLEVQYQSLQKSNSAMLTASSQLQKLAKQLLIGKVLGSEVGKAEVSYHEAKLAYDKNLLDYSFAVLDFTTQ